MRTLGSRYKKLFESCQKEKCLASKKKFVKHTKKERIETAHHQVKYFFSVTVVFSVLFC